jgi:peptidoglycan L-alanyl-D-glutamate endopeptidase CwlK
MASRDPRDLHPNIQPLYDKFMQECRNNDIDVLCTCTYRSNAEQDALYAQGRTLPGAIITNARGGQSAHNYTLDGACAAKAFDVVPMINGKCVWGTSGDDGILWQNLGQIGISLGLNWYGSPDSKFREFPHFELRE